MKIEFKVEECSWNANPREWDNLSKMVCFHGRYNLGDKTNYSQRDTNSWSELQKLICKTEDVLHIEPLYLYDHSGLAISTKPFNCPWDSGQIGFIYVTKQDTRKMFGANRITPKLKKQAYEILIAEFNMYSYYISGEVYNLSYTVDGEEMLEGSAEIYGFDNVEKIKEEIIKSLENVQN